tara:strand:+ start:1105 stop:2262 length:1158 start_codon:yes stop_codon:yes gene_type:complete
MWSRTQNYPLDNNDDQISIINRFFDFINNTRRLNNRIIEQNDNLAEMGYEIIVAFMYASRNNNSNTNTTSSRSNNNVSSTTTNINTPARNNTSRRRSRNRVVSSSTRGVSSRYTNMRNDWRNANRNNLRNLWQRNVRPRNSTDNNSNNVSRNPIQSPLPNIIPMFGPLSFQPTNNNTLEQLFQQSLQSVPIRPSTEHIERSTEERIFSQIAEPINDTCPITRNRFNDNDTVLQILECRHCFNPSSLRRWFETSVRCPICRYDIREYNPLNVINNPYRNNENDIENPITQTQDTQTEDTQDDDDNLTEDTTSSQDIARELVINELDNINNNPQLTEEQRTLANIISQSMNNPTNNEEIIQTETSIDSDGNLNLTYQFGLNLPQPPA